MAFCLFLGHPINENYLFRDYFANAEGEEEEVQEVDETDSEGGEYRPDDENDDEPQEEFEQDEAASVGEDDGEEREGDNDALPPKKRKQIMTDAEIEEATKQAMASKPVVRLELSPSKNAEGEEQKGEKEKNPEAKKDVS